MPDFAGFPIQKQIPEAKFEVAAYELLRSEPQILMSRLLHHRIPVQHVSPSIDVPRDILGRRLFVFERADGENNLFKDLSPRERCALNLNPMCSTANFKSTMLIVPRSNFSRSQHESVHHFLTSTSPSISLPIGSLYFSLNISPNYYLFLSPPHVNSV